MPYIKTIWHDGDIITESNMNKIEDGIESLNTQLASTNNEVAHVESLVNAINIYVQDTRMVIEGV